VSAVAILLVPSAVFEGVTVMVAVRAPAAAFGLLELGLNRTVTVQVALTATLEVQVVAVTV
jgi:hypothetical protein